MQRGLNADHAAADHDYALAHVDQVAQRVGRGVNAVAVEARDARGQYRRATGDPDYPVGLPGGRVVVIGLAAVADGHAGLGELELVPGHEGVHIGLEVRLARREGVAADGGALLPELDLVAGGLRVERGGAAAGAGADDEDAQGRLRLGDAAVYLMAADGVHGAGGVLERVGAGYAALVAGDAGADVLGAALGELVGQLGVGEEAAAYDREVADVVAQDALGLLDVGVAAVGQDGHGAYLPDGLGAAGLEGHLLDVVGRHGEVPVVMAAGVDVERVHAALEQPASELEALLYAAVALFDGQVVVGAVLDDDREVRSADLLGDGDELPEEAHAAVQVPAVLVRALIPARGEELVGEVAAVGVNLDGVAAGADGALRGGAVVVLELVYLVDAQLVAHDLRGMHPGTGACAYRHGVAQAGPADAAVAGVQLGADLAAQGVGALAQLLKIRRALVVEENGVAGVLEVVGRDYVAHEHGRAAPGALDEVLDAARAEVAHNGAHGGEDYAVFELEAAYLARLEQFEAGVVHH